MKQLRSKLTYANVVSTLCLFLLLGGGAAFAANKLAKNSVGAKQLKKNAVTTAKIKNAAVNAAKIADGAVTGAKIEDGAVSGAKVQASSLGTVPSAANANTLGGFSAGSFAPAQAEPLHVVGAPGEVPFETGWKAIESLPAFWKDPFGTVHLQGHASGTGASDVIIFNLPPGFRPAEEGFFEVYTSKGDHNTTIEVNPTGEIVLFSAEPTAENFVALDGISFRAAGT